MQVVDGWIKGLPKRESPNFSGKITPLYIVMHYTATWAGESAIRTLTTPAARVSAHFVLDNDGTLTQLVDLRRKAWHAGPSKYGDDVGLNNLSIGIEIANPGYLRHVEGNTYRDAYDNLKTVDRPLVKAAHARVGSGVFYWPEYTDAQLEKLDDLVSFLVKQYPTIKAIVSHEEIDTRGWKTDPGPAFPMQRYRDILDNKGEKKEVVIEPPPPIEEVDETENWMLVRWFRKLFDALFG